MPISAVSASSAPYGRHIQPCSASQHPADRHHDANEYSSLPDTHLPRLLVTARLTTDAAIRLNAADSHSSTTPPADPDRRSVIGPATLPVSALSQIMPPSGNSSELRSKGEAGSEISAASSVRRHAVGAAAATARSDAEPRGLHSNRTAGAADSSVQCEFLMPCLTSSCSPAF
jgi:hypothetical protein